MNKLPNTTPLFRQEVRWWANVIKTTPPDKKDRMMEQANLWLAEHKNYLLLGV